MGAPRPRNLPDSWHHRLVQIERAARLDRGAAPATSVGLQPVHRVGTPALADGWNTLAGDTLPWNAHASQALVTVDGSVLLEEALDPGPLPVVWGGYLRLTVAGVPSHLIPTVGLFVPEGAPVVFSEGNMSFGSIRVARKITTPGDITAAIEFYPWDRRWYPASDESVVDLTISATFIR